jgi:5S rRNA maturation endonuclease (ribonuclease M5)
MFELIKELDEIQVAMEKKKIMVAIDEDYAGLLRIMEQFNGKLAEINSFYVKKFEMISKMREAYNEEIQVGLEESNADLRKY